MSSSSLPSPTPTSVTFAVRGDHIPLDALLKATGLAPSGGIAKAMVADGLLRVDGQVELRKTCKLRPGQTVQLGDTQLRLVADDATGQTPAPDHPQ